MKDLPDELERALQGEWNHGQNRRILHRTREDGSNCSIGKDPALSVMRKADGWWFCCFRCGYSGFYGDNHKSPAEVRAALEALKRDKKFEAMDCIALPADFQEMTEDPSIHSPGVDIPYTAYNWFWEVNITDEVYRAFNVGWSNVYNRCVVPIYEYANFGKDDHAQKLVGWIGRDVRKLTKTERKVGKIAKYLTRKSSEYDRVYFHAPAESNIYVIVEDVLSAMKLWNVCEVNAIALLNTFVPAKLLMKLRNEKIVLWLDGDQLANTMQIVSKGNSLGCDVRYVHTSKDPKRYNTLAIKTYMRKVV